MADSEPRNSSSSLRKALLLLTVISEHPAEPDGLALGELARISGVNKSTVLRLSLIHI